MIRISGVSRLDRLITQKRLYIDFLSLVFCDCFYQSIDQSIRVPDHKNRIIWSIEFARNFTTVRCLIPWRRTDQWIFYFCLKWRKEGKWILVSHIIGLYRYTQTLSFLHLTLFSAYQKIDNYRPSISYQIFWQWLIHRRGKSLILFVIDNYVLLVTFKG